MAIVTTITVVPYAIGCKVMMSAAVPMDDESVFGRNCNGSDGSDGFLRFRDVDHPLPHPVLIPCVPLLDHHRLPHPVQEILRGR